MLIKFKYKIKNPSIFRGVFCLFLICVSLNTFGQAIIKFKDTKKNFGFVKKEEIVKVIFDFTNTGNQPLLIDDAKAGCDCTSIDYPEKPILPNQTAQIIVVFDTKSTYDRQDRTVEVFSNATKKISKIRFKGVVLSN